MKIILDGKWRMRKVSDSNWIEAEVPGSVCKDLLDAGFIEDPFYRENDLIMPEVLNSDFEYEREFNVEAKLLFYDKVILKFEGIDTISDVLINEVMVASTKNMHTAYEVDIKRYLKPGTNKIKVILYSPIEFMKRENQKLSMWGTCSDFPGYQYLRKAHFMFGWDWGPKIPDLGIWRSVSIEGYNYGKIKSVHIRQRHSNGIVKLTNFFEVDNFFEDDSLEVKVTLYDPEGKIKYEDFYKIGDENSCEILVDKPHLWWPNGYGAQYLYKIETTLYKDDEMLDKDEKFIGLREIKVKRQPDQWGESFQFEVNGLSIFIMGANYIPEDNLLGRYSPKKTEKLIIDCVSANFNCIRVWGGGIYPADYFYDLCDKYGLLVWQDFMFACSVYNMTDDFENEVKKEFEYNIKRIRHHACLAMWCGNNEIESAWVDWNIPQNQKLKVDYLYLFEKLIPSYVNRYDPDTYYWPSSPSSGGGFLEPSTENKGDVHYWDVFHGKIHYKNYRSHYFRFLSEFGLQSFPSIKTVNSYTLPEDRNIYSAVMENHNKCVYGQNGNITIMQYVAQEYRNPKNFEYSVYASMMLQAEGIKCCVEHLRRNRGRCMGVIYWQLNDCYPVASWSSIDYYGRWKALHYFAKRFYEKVLVSALERDKGIELYITNDSLENVCGSVKWRLINQKKGVLREGLTEVSVEPLKAICAEFLNFENLLQDNESKRNTYFEYEFYNEQKNKSVKSTVLFVPAKYFEFVKSEINYSAREDENTYILEFSSSVFTKGVEVDFIDFDAVLSDNYFDLVPGEIKTIYINKWDLSKEVTLDVLTNSITIKCVNNMSE